MAVAIRPLSILMCRRQGRFATWPVYCFNTQRSLSLTCDPIGCSDFVSGYIKSTARMHLATNFLIAHATSKQMPTCLDPKCWNWFFEMLRTLKINLKNRRDYAFWQDGSMDTTLSTPLLSWMDNTFNVDIVVFWPTTVQRIMDRSPWISWANKKYTLKYFFFYLFIS